MCHMKPGLWLRFWKRCQLAWSNLVELDTRLHSGLYQRFPKVMALGGWLLRTFYDFAVSPAFAVILSLLLVGLVISGVVPLIVSLSVVGAWLVAILSIAKNRQVNKLRIAERLVVVFGVAALMAWGADRYVKWCLFNYAKTQTAPHVIQGDTDKLAFDRFKELLESEVPKFVSIPSSNTSVASAKRTTVSRSMADLTLDFAGVEELQMMLRCKTSTPAEKPKHWFSMVDATNMFTWPGKPDEYQPLPLQTQTWDKDYIREDTATGPYDILSESPSGVAKQHVKRGDILVGVIGVTCINCLRARRYYVYFQTGSGGWFYPLPNDAEASIPVPKKKEASIAELEDFLDKEVPPSGRIPIRKAFH